jgi:hypothetical protein
MVCERWFAGMDNFPASFWMVRIAVSERFLLFHEVDELVEIPSDLSV